MGEFKYLGNSTFRHDGYRDGLAGNIASPPSLLVHLITEYFEGYEIGIADRQDQFRMSRMETETD
jgi:hypothetical protein